MPSRTSPRSPISLLLAALLGLSLAGFCTPAFAQSTATTSITSQPPDLAAPANPRLRNLFVVGNIGSANNTPGSAETALDSFFDLSKINVVNRTLSSTDIRSYLTAGDWQDTLTRLRPGDVVLLQFGPGPASTAPAVLPGVGDDLREIEDPAFTPRATLHTFGWYLRQYVVETIAHGAAPILCPPLSDTPGTQSYPAWVNAIAIEQRVGYLDLPAIMAARPQTFSYGAGSASSIIAGLKGLPLAPLAGYFSPGAERIAPYRPPPPPPVPTP